MPKQEKPEETIDAEAVATLPPIMTPEQAAIYLQIGERSIYTMAKDGEIPATKIAGQVRIHRAQLDQWVSEQCAQNIKP